MLFARVQTSATFIIGPVLDAAGVEFATGVIGDMSLSKNGSTLTALAAPSASTYIANGYYSWAATTGNLDTVGRAQVTYNKSTCQMPPLGIMVLPAMIYDSFVLGTGNFDANIKYIDASTTAATNLSLASLAIGVATVAAGATATSIPTSACSPSGAIADQFKGRSLVFKSNTATAALQGQATDILASSNAAAPTFTVTALTTAPASGDVFLIV
jgi:hypothetical protein